MLREGLYLTLVTKLDGRKQIFNKEKIEYAIQSAMKEVGELDTTTSVSIADEIEKEIRKRDDIQVSEIQDIVEDKLLGSKYKKTAKEYIFYRRKRDEERDKGSHFIQMVKKTMDLKNIERENANTDEAVFSARGAKVNGYMSKAYASMKLLDPKVRQYFEQNYIYIHDFNSYATGNHNCTTLDLQKIFKGGFYTNNSTIREPNSINSAFQLAAVVLQCQSNLQFGGCAIGTLDVDLAPYVDKSFKKHFKNGLKYIYDLSNDSINDVINGGLYEPFKESKEEYINNKFRRAAEYAWDQTVKETTQASEAFIHNLNTLQSRSGDQLPFTSINYGTDTTPTGRLITKSILKATMNGIGKQHLTPIFPVSVFQYYKGINDKVGTKNYDLFKLALKVTSKRLFPNYANCTASYFKKPTCKQEIFNTMG
jgi:ribonucleoside-triphosphate reductase